MRLYNIREVDFQHIDARGSLTQLIHNGFAQVNVLESKAGTKRGAHFHKVSVEAFFLIKGCVEVEFIGKEFNEKVFFKQGDFFEIHPYILHDMFFPEYCLMVQLYDKPVENEDGTKDIFMEEEFYA